MNQEVWQELQQRLPDDLTIVAVSKTHSKEEIDEAYACGCRIFAENRVQELQKKYDPSYIWHMIGHLQRNKVKQVVPLVSMIQSLDSLPLAKEIEKECARINKRMPVLIEVNISDEEHKTGISYEACQAFVQECMQLAHLQVQGLMCVGPLHGDYERIEHCFDKMHVLFMDLQKQYGTATIRYLSMGMSNDYEIALRHGANMIRLGTILFGQRSDTK